MVELKPMRGLFYRIGFNTFIQILGKTVSVVLSFITVGLLTRYLGQEGFGNFTLVFVYLSFFGMIADFGLQLTMVRELAKKRTPSEKIYGTYFWLKIFLVIVSTFLAIFSLAFFPYSRFLKTGIAVASVATAIGAINTYGTVIFQANLRLELVTLTDVLTKIITTVFIVLFVYLGLGFYNILNTVLIGNLCGSILIFFLIRQFIVFDGNFDLNLAKKMVIKSLPVCFISVLTLLYFKIDTLILSIFRNASEVGIYGLAYKIIENLLVLWGFYMATTYPLLSTLLSQNKKSAMKILWKKSILIGAIAGVLITVVGYFSAPLIIQILGGNEFKGSILALRILLFSVPLFFIDNLFYHTFLVKERLKYPLLAVVSSLLLNLFLNLIFIPKWGYIAAAANTLITEVILLSFYIFTYKFLDLDL